MARVTLPYGRHFINRYAGSYQCFKRHSRTKHLSSSLKSAYQKGRVSNNLDNGSKVVLVYGLAGPVIDEKWCS